MLFRCHVGASNILQFEFMLNLNLLPPQERQNLAYVFRTRAVAAVGGGVAALLIVFLVLLFPTIVRLVLDEREARRSLEIERQSQVRTGVVKDAEAVRQANRLAETAARHIAGGSAPLFEELFRIIPDPVRLDVIRLAAQDRALALEGFSPTRRDLLELVRALEAHPRVASVTSPVANLIRETDIRFFISAKLK